MAGVPDRVAQKRRKTNSMTLHIQFDGTAIDQGRQVWVSNYRGFW